MFSATRSTFFLGGMATSRAFRIWAGGDVVNLLAKRMFAERLLARCAAAANLSEISLVGVFFPSEILFRSSILAVSSSNDI